jgi:hypothetical protein
MLGAGLLSHVGMLMIMVMIITRVSSPVLS